MFLNTKVQNVFTNITVTSATQPKCYLSLSIFFISSLKWLSREMDLVTSQSLFDINFSVTLHFGCYVHHRALFYSTLCQLNIFPEIILSLFSSAVLVFLPFPSSKLLSDHWRNYRLSSSPPPQIYLILSLCHSLKFLYLGCESVCPQEIISLPYDLKMWDRIRVGIMRIQPMLFALVLQDSLNVFNMHSGSA